MAVATRPLKRYVIRHQGTEIVLETDSTKNNSILALLRALAREVKKSRPEDWNEFVKRVIQADQSSERKDPVESEDDTFFERLMQKQI